MDEKAKLVKEMLECSKKIYEYKQQEREETDPAKLEALQKKRKELQYQCLFYLEKIENTFGEIDEEVLRMHAEEMKKYMLFFEADYKI